MKHTIRKLILSFARLANRVLASVLPRRFHFRLERACKAALQEYINSGRLYLEATAQSGQAKDNKPFAKRVGRLDLAKPQGELIGIQAGVRQTCELVICCAFTGRHEILERIIEESFAANEMEGVRWFLAGSTEDDEKFIRAISLRTRRVAGMIVENRPLGRKWQTCMKLAHRHFDAGLYAITGSDDMLSHTLVDHVIRRHRLNRATVSDQRFLPALYASYEWLVLHNNAKSNLVPQIIKCSYKNNIAFQPLGAGRFYSGAFMDECDGFVFESQLERLLDDRGYELVKRRDKAVEDITLEDGVILSVKGNWAQMNTLDGFLASKTLVLHDYSFKGYDVLRKNLSDASCRQLFRQPRIAPQLTFSTAAQDMR